MSDQAPFSFLIVAAVLLSVCLLVVAVAPGAVAGGVVADGLGAVDSGAIDSGGVNSGVTDPEAADPDAVSSDPTPGSDAVAPGLRSANGTVEVVVRFAGDAQVGTGGAARAAESGGSATLSTTDLKSNAANAQADFESFAERKPGVTVERGFWLANAMLVTIDTRSVAVERLLDVRGVERVHENFEVKIDSATTPERGNTPRIGPPGPAARPTSTVSSTSTGANATYGVEMVRAPEVWETFGTRGEGATVAVLDTGIDPDHPDLTVSGWAEIDKNGGVIQNDSGPYDLNGHGTHVSGTVAGKNASGTAIGVAPEAKIHAIKVFPEDSRSTSFTRIIGGMEAALNESVVGERADVLQMSLGADGYYSQMIEPVRNANNAGAIVIASSGNRGENNSSSPANVYDSLAVGAVDSNKNVASFSSGESVTTDDAWGDNAPTEWPDEYVVPDVSAPGVDVNSSVPGGGYDDTYSGTSMAAPHVSGVAALMLAATSRNVSSTELYDTLRDTTNHPENNSTADTRYGTGIVDGFAAVSATDPFYNVTDLDAPNVVERGGTLNTTVTVANVDRISGDNRTVDLRLADPANASNVTTLAAEDLSLGPGNATTLALNGTVPTEFGTGETTVTVASPEETVSASIQVTDAVGTVNGTVTDAETSETLTDIDMIVRNGTEVVGTTVTGAAGSYAVDVPATNLTVTASNATYAPANRTVELNRSGDTATANLALALRNGTLSGVVNASDGLDAPPNATVTVTNDTGAAVAGVDAGGEGAYSVDLRPGTYDATADAPDFENETRAGVVIAPNATTSEAFALTPRPASLSGVVTNATDGEAVSGATVSVGGERSTTTDANGTYALDARDRGELEITVSAEGYTEQNQTLDFAANDSRVLNVSLSPRGVFEIIGLPGVPEIERGSSGGFTVTVRNDGRVTDAAAVDVALNRSASVSPETVVIDGVGVGGSGSGSVTVSLGSSAATGTYAVTATTPDSEETVTFVGVSGDDGTDGSDSDGGGGSDGGDNDGSGGGGGGGSGGGGGGNQPSPPADDTNTDDDPESETTEPTNETDDLTNETGDLTNTTDDLTNETGDLTNETNGPTNATDGPTAEADESVDGGGADGGDGEADVDDETNAGSDETGTDGGADGGDSTDGAPGFGPVVGVFAVLAVALRLRRRD